MDRRLSRVSTPMSAASQHSSRSSKQQRTSRTASRLSSMSNKVGAQASSPDEPKMSTGSSRPRLTTSYTLNNVVYPPRAATEDTQVKPDFQRRFRNLCERAGWTPTSTTRAKLAKLAKMEGWKADRNEPIMFAFVQHFDFVWENNTIFLGLKVHQGIQRKVWYRATVEGRNRALKFYFDGGKTQHRPEHTADRVDSFCLPFQELFGIDELSRESQSIYLNGLYDILLAFPSLRRTRDPNNPGQCLPRIRPPSLPFLPESAWMTSPESPQSSDSSSREQSIETESASEVEYPVARRTIERGMTSIAERVSRRITRNHVDYSLLNGESSDESASDSENADLHTRRRDVEIARTGKAVDASVRQSSPIKARNDQSQPTTQLAAQPAATPPVNFPLPTPFEFTFTPQVSGPPTERPALPTPASRTEPTPAPLQGQSTALTRLGQILEHEEVRPSADGGIQLPVAFLMDLSLPLVRIGQLLQHPQVRSGPPGPNGEKSKLVHLPIDVLLESLD